MKKICAYILLAAVAVTMLCACEKKENDNGSSGIASFDEIRSEVTTSSAPDETESEDDLPSGLDSSSQKDNSSNKAQTDSKNETTSEKEDLTSKNDSTSSKTSANKKPGITRPGTSSQAQSVKLSVNERRDVVFCAFSTDTTMSYGKSREERLEELEDVVAAGYVNSLSDRGNLSKADFQEIVLKYDLTTWYSAFAVFNSKKQTIEEYIAGVDRVVSVIRSNPEWWEHFNGFWFDEKIWRGQTNEDFVTETRALYQKYGKRLYAVLATGEFSDVEGNDDLIGTTADEMNKILPSSFKHITDVAFDSYGIDVREGAFNGDLEDGYKDIMPGIVDGKSYYREYTQLLLRLVDHSVNLWYLPCSYTCSVKEGLGGIRKADEEYCLAHLNFFFEELENRKNAGGLMHYCYGSFSDKVPENKGLQWWLIVEGDADSDQKYKLRPEEPNKWKKYSKRLKEIVSKYNSTKAEFVR